MDHFYFQTKAFFILFGGKLSW